MWCLNSLLFQKRGELFELSRFSKVIKRFISSTSASQLVEEALLLGVSFLLLVIVLGVVQNVTSTLSSFLNQAWKEIEEAANGLFGWVWSSNRC